MRQARAWPLVLLLAATACTPRGARDARMTSNPEWSEPSVGVVDGSAIIANYASRWLLVVAPADEPVDGTRILFWGDQAAASSGDAQFVANTDDHEILAFGTDLKPVGALAPQSVRGDRVQRPITVAAGPDDRLVAFEASGGLVVFDRWGREFRRLEHLPFAHNLGTFAPGGSLLLARSPYGVAFAPEALDAPLFARLELSDPRSPTGVGQVREALSAFYINAANAGTLVSDSAGNVYFAALARPEVVKLDAGGARVWSSTRTVDFETPEPRLVPNPDGPAKLALATVQKAIAIGADGQLYVRSARNEAATADRLDVLDPASGSWLASAEVDTGTVLLIGPHGAAFELTPSAMLEERVRERREFTSFALASFAGDSLSLDELRGDVKLISFWASWCGPCRDELPLLDSLQTALARDDFRVIGINEDVNEEDARAFAAELGLSFTNVLGRGAMRRRYHYTGLPYTVLIDREGRVVKEYYGFGGREKFDEEVAARVRRELDFRRSEQ